MLGKELGYMLVGFFLHVVFLNTLRLNLLLLISKIGSYDLIYLNNNSRMAPGVYHRFLIEPVILL